MTTALLVIDMLNRYEHDDAGALAESVAESVPNIRLLLDAARDHGNHVAYVNDNHGEWTADRHELCNWAVNGARPDLVKPILPDDDIPLLVKARHSAFYATQLDYFLHSHDINRIILTGQVTEQCILYSALDAYVRHFEVAVPRDAVAHIHRDLSEAALTMMQRNMRARVGTTKELIGTLT